MYINSLGADYIFDEIYGADRAVRSNLIYAAWHERRQILNRNFHLGLYATIEWLTWASKSALTLELNYAGCVLRAIC